jgi:hypothetical protein
MFLIIEESVLKFIRTLTTHDLVRVLCCGALQSDGLSSFVQPVQPAPPPLYTSISLTASYINYKFRVQTCTFHGHVCVCYIQ